MRISHNQVQEDQSGRWNVRLNKTLDDGTVEEGCHVMPTDIMEWRAAEYGIDPTDVDTLLDIVLAEPYLTAEDWAVGTRLIDAPDIATARADHIARCARAKLRHRMSTRPSKAAPDHPLEVIRRNHRIDPDVIAVKAEYVSRMRLDVAAEAVRSTVADAALSRAEKMRRDLGIDQDGAKERR